MQLLGKNGRHEVEHKQQYRFDNLHDGKWILKNSLIEDVAILGLIILIGGGLVTIENDDFAAHFHSLPFSSSGLAGPRDFAIHEQKHKGCQIGE